MENHHRSQRNLPLLLDALYCEENHLENEAETEECFTDEEDKSFDIGSFDLLFSWDDEELSSLLSKEQENGLFNFLEKNQTLVEARHEAIEWMLNVVEHYSFSALTAVLSVNYLDRFLFLFQSHSEKPWMIQLSAVACLSLAAKVEETQVPLLLDLQVEESKYVFEAKTIQRMEILVLSTLQWKMNPVTPLSFLDYITRRLGLKCNLSWKFLRRCECLLLTIISSRFMSYKPSVIATAIMLHVINNIEPSTLVEFQDQLIHTLGINKEKVEDCSRVIDEVASTVDLYSSCNKRKYASLPGSPKGVMDISFSSSDSSNDSWAVEEEASDFSQPEPLSKKTKAHE